MSKKADSKHNEYFEDVELWETKQLGASAKHAKPATAADDKALDDDLGLAPISLRLQKDVVAKLKILAKQEGLGYQTYIRQILTRHVREVTPVKTKESA
jgi:predicted DNA binding CopG/RHH family protein